MRHRRLRRATSRQTHHPRRPQASRVPRLRLGGHRADRARRHRRGARGRQPRRALRGGRRERLRSQRRASATPAGRRTAGRATRTPTRTATAADASPSSSTASSRTTRSCAPARGARPHLHQRDRRRGRGAPDRGARGRGSHRGRARRARARSRATTPSARSRPTSRTWWSARGTSARWWWASATARCSSPRPSRPFWRTRAAWSCSRTATSSRSAPTARSTPTSPDSPSSATRRSSRATTTRPRRAATRPSCSRRSTSSRRRFATRSPAGCARTGPSTSPRWGWATSSCAACGASSSSPAAPRTTPASSSATPSSSWLACRSRSTSPASSATAQPVFDPDTLVIGITQSGETADTLAAMRLAREAGSPVLALTNIQGSQATRDADFVLFTRAGLEIGVAATKTHTAQVAALLLLALRLSWARGAMGEVELKRLGHELRAVPELAEQLLARPSAIRGDRRALPRRALLPLPGPRHGLRRLPRGRAQAQGDQLHPHRGLRRRRDEARPHRPAGRGVARRGRRRRRAGLATSWSATSRRSAPAAPT